MIAVQDVPRDQTGSYGIVATDSFQRPPWRDQRDRREAQARRRAEHAGRGRPLRAQSRASSRCWRTTPPGAGGEIQLTDGIAALLQGRARAGLSLRGPRFDCGTPHRPGRSDDPYALDHEDLSDAARPDAERAGRTGRRRAQLSPRAARTGRRLDMSEQGTITLGRLREGDDLRRHGAARRGVSGSAQAGVEASGSTSGPTACARPAPRSRTSTSPCRVSSAGRSSA